MRLWIGIALVVLAGLVLLPVFWMIGTSFWTPETGLTLEHYREVFGSPTTKPWPLLVDTMRVAGSAALLAMLLGVPYALLITRVAFPGRRLFTALAIVPILMPPLVHAVGWNYAEIPLYDWWGNSLLFAFAYFPFVVLLTSHGLRQVSKSMEESARLSRSTWHVVTGITLRSALPGIFAGALFVIIFTASDWSVPDYLYFSSQRSVYLFPVEIFRWWQRLGEPEAACAVATPAVLLTVILLALVMRLRGRKFATVDSAYQKPEDFRPGALGWLGTSFCTLVLGVSGGLPLFALTRASGSLSVYPVVFKEVLDEFINSMLIAAGAATWMVVLAFFLAYAITRLRPWMGRTIELVSILPLAVPGVMLACGYIRLWNRPTPVINEIYTSLWMAVIVYGTRFLPLAVLALTATLMRISPSLEESAAVAGRRWSAGFFSILTPLSLRGLWAAWLLGFAFTLKDIDIAAVLPAANASLSMRLNNMVHFAHDERAAALSVLMVAAVAMPVLLTYLIAPRFFGKK
ncbi:MAG: iron ABC transporter permease [Planctomycetota bacterium]